MEVSGDSAEMQWNSILELSSTFIFQVKGFTFLECVSKSCEIKWAFQPSVMGGRVNICVPSSSRPGRSASQQARRRNTSVRSDGLTVIRVAAFGQQNTGQNVSPSLPELSDSGFC